MNDSDDYAVGISDILSSPFGQGLMASATGGDRTPNPHPVESSDWCEWMHGFEAWEIAPKVEIEISEGHQKNPSRTVTESSTENGKATR